MAVLLGLDLAEAHLLFIIKLLLSIVTAKNLTSAHSSLRAMYFPRASNQLRTLKISTN
jgi:hypothetical protein